MRDSYFDVQGNPVRCTAGYHSYERIYDEQGRVTALQFLDESGKPVKNRTGYSREERILSDNGRIMEVTYHDEQGKPTPNTAGQYGERYVRDEKGRVTQITYLDGERNPAPNKAGYDVIALQYSVSWGAIERNLRIISQRAWDTDPVYIEKLAGYPMSKRPTASQLIEIILHNVQREQ